MEFTIRGFTKKTIRSAENRRYVNTGNGDGDDYLYGKDSDSTRYTHKIYELMWEWESEHHAGLVAAEATAKPTANRGDQTRSKYREPTQPKTSNIQSRSIELLCSASAVNAYVCVHGYVSAAE